MVMIHLLVHTVLAWLYLTQCQSVAHCLPNLAVYSAPPVTFEEKADVPAEEFAEKRD
jgi:hypothetical protein